MRGQTIWITGLSGAGKTTIARKLAAKLRMDAANVICLDGDELRDVFALVSDKGAHHDRHQRSSIALQYGRLCQVLSSQNMTVVIATISMFKEVYSWNRDHLKNYFEVYLKVPMEELKRRDPKGLYRRYADGKTRSVAGLDLAIDEPVRPHLQLDFAPNQTADQMVERIIQELPRGCDEN